MAIAPSRRIRTKELTQQQEEFIPKLINWLVVVGDGDEYFTAEKGMRWDVPHYISMLRKIRMLGEYTLDEAEELNKIMKIYNDKNL